MPPLLTGILLAVSLAMTALCLWRGLRTLPEPEGRAKLRVVPWMPLAMLGAAISLALLTHLVNLAGIETGGRFR